MPPKRIRENIVAEHLGTFLIALVQQTTFRCNQTASAKCIGLALGYHTAPDSELISQ